MRRRLVRRSAALYELRLCPGCGGRLCLYNFPRLADGTRSEVCGVCAKYPTTVRRDAA